MHKRFMLRPKPYGMDWFAIVPIGMEEATGFASLIASFAYAFIAIEFVCGYAIPGLIRCAREQFIDTASAFNIVV